MRHKSGLILRLFTMLALAFGLAAFMGASPASAQDVGECQVVTAGGDIAQDADCEVVFDEEAGTCELLVDGEAYPGTGICESLLTGECPDQYVGDDGTIIQVQCDDETPVTPTETPVTPTATETPVTPTETATETPVTPTETATETPVTPTETATEAPTEDDGGQAEPPVQDLPDTGQGSAVDQGGSTLVMLLGAMSVLMLVAGLMFQRRQA